MRALFTCIMYTTCMPGGHRGKKKKSDSFVTGVTESYEPPRRCLGLNWGLLENQKELLTTETSLQLQFYFSLCLK